MQINTLGDIWFSYNYRSFNSRKNSIFAFCLVIDQSIALLYTVNYSVCVIVSLSYITGREIVNIWWFNRLPGKYIENLRYLIIEILAKNFISSDFVSRSEWLKQLYTDFIVKQYLCYLCTKTFRVPKPHALKQTVSIHATYVLCDRWKTRSVTRDSKEKPTNEPFEMENRQYRTRTNLSAAGYFKVRNRSVYR